MLLVDSNVWLAAADRRVRDHARCRAVLDEHRTELESTVPVIAETAGCCSTAAGPSTSAASSHWSPPADFSRSS